MTFKTVIFAAILGMTPGFALAMGGCGADHDRQAMSCAQGTVWDDASQSCVDEVTS